MCTNSWEQEWGMGKNNDRTTQAFLISNLRLSYYKKVSLAQSFPKAIKLNMISHKLMMAKGEENFT